MDFDSTQNLLIEGDNLDALKLLHETYLNKLSAMPVSSVKINAEQVFKLLSPATEIKTL